MPRRTWWDGLRDFATDPKVQRAAGRFAGAVIPEIAAAQRAMRQSAVFPVCELQRRRRQCGNTGVGLCFRCNLPFCAAHGLLYVARDIDPSDLSVEILGPVQGLCLACIKRLSAIEEAATSKASPGAPRPSGNRGSAWQGAPFEDGPSQEHTGHQPHDHDPAKGRVNPSRAAELAKAYLLLGLHPGCSLDDLKRRHRELVLRYHSDQDVGRGDDVMAKINHAVDVVREHIHATQ